MLRELKRSISALLAASMVFSSWAMAWADTGAEITAAHYDVELVSHYSGVDNATGTFYNNVEQDVTADFAYDVSSDHSLLVNIDDKPVTLYVDQAEHNGTVVTLQEIVDKYMAANPTEQYNEFLLHLPDLLISEGHDPAGLYGDSCYAILHVETRDQANGKLSVSIQDASVGSNKKWSLIPLNDDDFDQYYAVYAYPDAPDTTKITLSLEGTTDVSTIDVKKGVPYTEFFIREDAFLRQPEGSAIASYENGQVSVGSTINYLPGDTMHFVFEKTKTLAGNANDTIEYRLFDGNTDVTDEADYDVNVNFDADNASASVVVSGDGLVLGKIYTLKIFVRSLAYDADIGDDLARPVVPISIKIMKTNPIKSISFNDDSYEISTVTNKTKDLSSEIIAVAEDPNEEPIDYISYSSSDDTIATVDEDTGVVTAVKAGTVTITATSEKGGVTGTCEVTVLPEVEAIDIKGPSQLIQGYEKEVEFTVDPEYDGAETTITWTSDDTNLVIDQSADGKTVKLLYPEDVDLGDVSKTVTLTATAASGVSKDYEVKVLANPATEDIEFTVEGTSTDPENLSKAFKEITAGEEYSLYDGQSAKITSELKDSNGNPSQYDLVWKVSVKDTNIDNLDLTDSKVKSYLSSTFDPDTKELNVTFLEGKNGVVTLTAYAYKAGETVDLDNDYNESITFNVNVKTTSINFTSDADLTQLVKGQEVVVKYSLQPNDDLNKDVVYVESTDETILEVVAVDNDAKTITLKAVGSGNASAKVYATYDADETAADQKYYTYIDTVDVKVKKDLSEAEITNNITGKVFKNEQYTAEDIASDVVVKFNDRELVRGTDYELTIKDGGFDAGTCTVTVTGMGATYAGEKDFTFEIAPYDITSDGVVTVKNPDKIVYSGLALTPDAEVTVPGLGDIVLESGDYTLTYSGETTDVSTTPGIVTAEGTGNYTGTVSAEFTIKPAAIGNTEIVKIETLPDVVYDATEHEPDITAKNANTNDPLVLGQDYTLSYSDNVEVGFAEVTITGMGNYTGTTMYSFEITPATSVDIADITDVITYNGETQCPEPEVTFNGAVLAKDTDYEVVWEDNIDAGTGKVIVTGKGNFDFEKTVEFTINPYELDVTKIAENPFYIIPTYDGFAQEPAFTLILKDSSVPALDGLELTLDDDYTVAYSDNINAGDAAVATFTGTGNFTGTFDLNFTIKAADVSVMIIAEVPNETYTGEEIKPAISAKLKMTSYDAATQEYVDNYVDLVEGTDYTLSYKDNINAGKAEIIVKGMGNYKATTTRSVYFTIDPRSMADVTIDPVDSLIYNGTEQTPAPIATYNSMTLVEGDDYTLTYKDNKNVGTATITLTGKGNYTGDKSVTFDIEVYELTEANTVVTYDEMIYNGLPQTPEFKIKINDPASALNGTYIVRDDEGSADYTVAYSNNVNASTEAVAAFAGTNNFTGGFDFLFTIMRAPVTAIKVAEVPNMTYTGDVLEPDVDAVFEYVTKDSEGYPKVETIQLIKDQDYTLTYENNVNASNTDINPHMAKITFTATDTSNFQGTDTFFFVIDPLVIGDGMITVDPIANETYNLDFHTPDPVVTFDNGNGVTYVMAEGTDYEVDWANNFDATDAAEVIISGLNNFTSDRTETFVIDPYELTNAAEGGNATVEIERVVYNGLPQTPEVKIVVDNAADGFKEYEIVRNDKGYNDFMITYTDNVNSVDNSFVTVTGTNNYTGTFVVPFKIIEADVNDAAFVIEKIDEVTYTGTEFTPAVVAQWLIPNVDPDGAPTPYDLVEGVDYTVEYAKNTDAGVADVIVTGIGNFQEVRTVHFTINKKDITEDDVVFTDIEDLTYTTKEITPYPEMVYNGMTLVNGKDASVEYKNNVNAGTATATVTGIGNYKGTKAVNFTILPYELTADNTKVTIDPIEFNGLAREPKVSIYVNDFERYISRNDGGTADFAIKYSDNVNAGDKALATITGTKNYTGEFSKNFTIAPTNVTNMNIQTMDSMVYTGSDLTPDIVATNRVTGAKLVLGTDYELTYKNNKNVGTATVTVKGIGNYKTTRNVTFRIASESIAKTEISVIADQTYAFGKAITPKPVIKFAGKTLVEGVDYRLSYKDNVNAGKATVTITGLGNFGATTTRTFKINPFELTDTNVKIAVAPVNYDGTAKKPDVTVTIKSTGKNISRNDNGGADFKAAYSGNVNAGKNTASVVITGTNNFKGKVTMAFTINTVNIDYAGAAAINPQEYTAKAVTPKVKLTYKSRTLKEGTDYTLTYANNIKSGDATITVKGMGNFFGTKTVKFKIKNSPIVFNAKSATVVAGSTQKLPFTATDTIKWTSSNPKICKVNADGVVMGVKAGQVTITGKAKSGISDTITVQVLFKDVTSDFDFWYKPTYYLANSGVVKGYDNQTTFKPANECTRAQMVTFLWRLQGEPAPKSTTSKFSDVKSSDYFFKAVLWASEKKIVEGYSDGTFGPQIVCQRKHAVTFMWRMAGKPTPTSKKSPFSDISKSDYFYKPVLWASEKGIVAGYEGGLFKPEGKCLRRQMVTFLYKYDKFVNGKG